MTKDARAIAHHALSQSEIWEKVRHCMDTVDLLDRVAERFQRAVASGGRPLDWQEQEQAVSDMSKEIALIAASEVKRMQSIAQSS